MTAVETLSISDATALLGLSSRNQIYRAIDNGHIEVVYINGTRHVRREGLEEAWAKVPKTKANHQRKPRKPPADPDKLRPVEIRTAPRQPDRPAVAPPPPDQEPEDLPDYNTSRARSEFEKANLLELQRKTQEGLLLRREDVEQATGKAVNMARTKVLGVPSRAKQQIPHLSAEEVELLRELLREALEELSAMEVAA